MVEPILLGKSGADTVVMLPELSARHGLIAGATGTGKTVTLATLAEAFSARGVPVFMADVKGDLAGLSQAGSGGKLQVRAQELGLSEWSPRAWPVTFWDVHGEKGHPVRTTVSELGPLLFARLLNLNEVQEGVLSLVFKLADDEGLLLLDLKDLRAMLQYAAENAAALQKEYGNVSPASVGAIQRGLLSLEQQGGDRFFGEPALQLLDFLQTSGDGRGLINILAADRLLQSPRLYATFLLWMLAELFEMLPEVGDLPQPKLVFFFDEAHLLFDGAPKVLVDKIEQIVRLIRSKGVGVYFVTQSPQDLPEVVLGQLGNRVQHALRAFTPKDQKAVRAAAETFRANPTFDTATAITELAVGEALVSCLDERGAPGIVARVLIAPPTSRVGAVTAAERSATMASSLVAGAYDQAVDRESAYERLKARASSAEAARTEFVAAKEASRQAAAEAKANEREAKERAKLERERQREASKLEAARAKQTKATINAVAKVAGSPLGKAVVRGILGSLFGGR